MDTVKERELLPGFRLKSVSGSLVGPQDYRGKKNVVVVFFDPLCAECSDFLNRMSERYDDYKEADAEILAVGVGRVSDVRDFSEKRNLPFPVLADEEQLVMLRYVTELPSIFVADRYGEVRIVITPDKTSHFPEQTRILDRLQLIELECPECGVPTWTP